MQYRMKCFVRSVLEEDRYTSAFLQKIQDYHDETGLPIFVSIKCKPPPYCPATWLRAMLPQHTDLVRQFLPVSTVQTAYRTYWRSQYEKCKLQEAFVRDAITQVQEYDPFFLTMDEIHQSDMLVMGMISKKQFYQEKIMDVRK